MNVNRVTLIGHLTRDPYSKEFGENRVATNFAIATNRKGKNKQNATEYHNIVAFDKLGNICKDFLKKGKLVYVTGRLHTSRFEDKNKVMQTKVEVVASEMLLLERHQASVSAEKGDDSDATEAVYKLSPKQASQLVAA